ncbi:MAG: hypothetical protein RIF32_14045 [Leptospirales bacterium]|jgi:hypothetical protein
MKFLRDIDPREIASIRRMLALETRQYRIGAGACASAAIALALFSAWGFIDPAQSTDELRIALPILAILTGACACWFSKQARSVTYEFGRVQEISGAFAWRMAGGPRYSYPEYSIAGRPIEMPMRWATENAFARNATILAHVAEVQSRRDGQSTRTRTVAVEIPGFKRLIDEDWFAN